SVFYNESITANPDSDIEKVASTRLTAVEAKSSGKPVDAEHKKKRFLLF
ncbi:MAG: hypothetical protein JWM35_968, partial [Verrucomicrobia bacterium]|nr:hypothetical protein [Verrucomicrobiota bacterium]